MASSLNPLAMSGGKDAFEGMQLEMNVPVSAQFQVGHSFSMGAAQQPAQYSIAPTYALPGGQLVVMARMDTGGLLFSNWLFKWGKFLNASLQVQMNSQRSAVNGEASFHTA